MNVLLGGLRKRGAAEGRGIGGDHENICMGFYVIGRCEMRGDSKESNEKKIGLSPGEETKEELLMRLDGFQKMLNLGFKGSQDWCDGYKDALFDFARELKPKEIKTPEDKPPVCIECPNCHRFINPEGWKYDLEIECQCGNVFDNPCAWTEG